MENSIKLVKTLLLSLIAGMTAVDRVLFFSKVLEIVQQSLDLVKKASVTPVEKNMAAVQNQTVANRTLAKVVEPTVASYDGSCGFPDTSLPVMQKPVTVTTITKKGNGVEKRQEPPKAVAAEVKDEDGNVFGAKKGKRFFPGMNKDTLLSYGYFVNDKKVSCTEFSKIILPLKKEQICALTKEGRPNHGKMLYSQYWSKADYAFPRQWIKSQANPSVAVWACQLAGIHFRVQVMSK